MLGWWNNRTGLFVSVMMGLLCAGCDLIAHSGPPPTVTGSYYQPVASQYRPRLGITTLDVVNCGPEVSADRGFADRATDQLAEFLKKSNRFTVIDRSTFATMLKEQGLSDILHDDALARPVRIDGVDYVLFGTISDLQIEKTLVDRGTFAKMTGVFNDATEATRLMVRALCTVSFSVVDPATGDVVASNSSEYDVTKPGRDIGIEYAPSTSAPASPVVVGAVPVTEKDRNQIVRLALDDAVAKSLSKIDRAMASQSRRSSIASAATRPTSTTANAAFPGAPPATVPASGAAKVICNVCGAENDAETRFCRQCGAKMP